MAPAIDGQSPPRTPRAKLPSVFVAPRAAPSPLLTTHASVSSSSVAVQYAPMADGPNRVSSMHGVTGHGGPARSVVASSSRLGMRQSHSPAKHGWPYPFSEARKSANSVPFDVVPSGKFVHAKSRVES